MVLAISEKSAYKLEWGQLKPFKTNIGVLQGDCPSPILSTIYLAKVLRQLQTPAALPNIQDHTLPS